MLISWNGGNFDPTKVPPAVAEAYTELSLYVEQFLCGQHPHRKKGPVCPFVPAAHAASAIDFVPAELNSANGYQKLLEEAVALFRERSQGRKVKGSVVIFFPEAFPGKELEALRESYFDTARDGGLMLGAFHEGAASPSLHSPDYFPQRSPIPILIIRDLVLDDVKIVGRASGNWWQKLKLTRTLRNMMLAHGLSPQSERVRMAESWKRWYLLKIVVAASLAITLLGIGIFALTGVL